MPFSFSFVFFVLRFVSIGLRLFRAFVSKTALNAEWEKEWKESDFTGDLAKVQKEAEERLDSKIAELMSNIEKTGVGMGEN
jgi:hypothetical protein